VHAFVFRNPERFLDEITQLLGTLIAEAISGVHILAEADLSLMRERRERPAALVSIDDQQVNSV
jgi:hypothetical protein